MAVESYDDRIDPVGACVGMKGSRIHGIVRELKNENIDIMIMPHLHASIFPVVVKRRMQNEATASGKHTMEKIARESEMNGAFVVCSAFFAARGCC